MKTKVTRTVSREGRTVRFSNVAGGFVGPEYVYEAPTITAAVMLERDLKRIREDGMPADPPMSARPWRKSR